mgnify:CR=1 FL=1
MSTFLPVGKHLFEALAQQEIIRLLDALWATLPPDRQSEVLDQLPPDTRQTVQHILCPPRLIRRRGRCAGQTGFHSRLSHVGRRKYLDTSYYELQPHLLLMSIHVHEGHYRVTG